MAQTLSGELDVNLAISDEATGVIALAVIRRQGPYVTPSVFG